MRLKSLFIATVALLLTGTPIVFARSNIVDSLEWRAADSTYIVQAKVADIAESPGKRGQVKYRDLKLAEIKILKGDIKPENVALRLRVLGDDPLGIAWKSSGDTFIFFLEPGKNENDSEMGGHHVLRDLSAFIDLDHPKRVFTAAMKEETSREEILKLIAANKALNTDTTPVGNPNVFKPRRGYSRLEIPGDAPIFNQVFGGSTCYINVPASEKTRAIAVALSESKDVSDRISGADMLLSFPSPETKKLLTDMLSDEAIGQSYGSGSLIAIVYPVRQAAYDTLVEMGEKPTPPILNRLPTAAELADYQKSRTP